MRVQWEKWLPYVDGKDAEWVEQMRGGGQPILLSDKPKAYWRQAGNYWIFTEHSEKCAAEFRRLVERGAVEGPLHYRPHVVNPQSGVWQPEKQKWRTIYDLTASGINEMTLPMECSYDMLDDMLPRQQPDCWQFGWDLQDAFFNTGRWQEHADYMGLENTESGEFCRHRFALFGGSDCPSHQQPFSDVLARVMNRAGKKLGWPDTETTAVYMDDGHGVQPGEASEKRAK